MAKTTYSISDLASEFAVTTRTIRFYEEKGLLTPERAGNSRIYSPTDRTKLKLILRGKRLGFTLEESRDIIAMYEPGHDNVEQLDKLLNGIRAKRTQLEQQFHDLEAMMLELREAEDNCVQASSAVTAKTKKHARA